MPPPNNRTAGFSIIEVLVAFVILSMVVTLCLQVYANSARAETTARWSEQAHIVLRDRLAALPTLNLRPGEQLDGVAADGLRWTVAASQPTTDVARNSAHSVIWFTAEVTDPTGHTYTASTARWFGEAFPEGAQ
jgi:Tfp pilus assembly protein PilV